MGAFLSTLDQMLFLFLCILIGFMLNRFRVLSDNAGTVMSRMENFVFVPALIINNFRQYCTGENLRSNGGLLLYSVIFLAISLAVAFVLAPLFTKDRSEYGIYRYSIAVTNFAFMGNSLVQGMFGDEVLFQYLIFTIPFNIFIYSAGVIWLTAGKKKFSLRMMVNPMFLSLIIGIVLGLTSLPLPSFLTKTIGGCAACFSPMAMILTGFTIGKYELKKLIGRVNIYVLTAIRIVLMPLAAMLLCGLVGITGEVRMMILFAMAMPLGLNTIIFPAAYGLDDNIGASMAVISNVAGLITVPLILSMFL